MVMWEEKSGEVIISRIWVLWKEIDTWEALLVPKNPQTLMHSMGL